MKYQLLEKSSLAAGVNILSSIFRSVSMTFEKGTVFIFEKEEDGVIHLTTETSPFTLKVEEKTFRKIFKKILIKKC